MKTIICSVAFAMLALTIGCAGDTDPEPTTDEVSETESALTCLPSGYTCIASFDCCSHICASVRTSPTQYAMKCK